MTSEVRTRFLMLLLPALAIAGIYSAAFNRDKTLTAARKSLEAARATAVSPDTLEAERTRVEKLRADTTALNEQKVDLDKRWNMLIAQTNQRPNVRNAAFSRISRMLWKQGLFSVEEASLETTAGQLPGSLEETLKMLGSQTASSQQRIWRMKFIGRYPDVMATLQDMGTENLPVIPIAITMSEASLDSEWRIWTLLLWM